MKKKSFVTKALSSTLAATLLLSPVVSVYAAVPNTQTNDDVPFIRAENGDLYLTESFQDQSAFWLDSADMSDFSVTKQEETPTVEVTSSANEASSSASSSNSSSENAASSENSSSPSSSSTSASSTSSSSTTSDSASSSASSQSKSDSQISDDSIEDSDTFTQADGAQGFVERLYLLVMGRAGDESGINFWTNSLINNDFTAAFVIQSFFNSTEFSVKNTSDEEYIAILYLTLFDRPNSQPESDFWLSILNCGVSRDFLLSSFVSSEEFGLICEQYTVSRGAIPLSEYRDRNFSTTGFVSNLYKTTLNREASVDELNFWTKNLISDGGTGGSIVSAFFNSQEHINMNLSDTEFIQAAYQAMFGRPADEGGISTYLALLNKDFSRSYILSLLANSEEFRNACNSAAISVGRVQTEPRDQNNDITQFVKRTFSTILDRPADVGALNTFTSIFLNGQNAATYFSILFGSQEFQNRNLSNEQTTRIIYQSMLNRDADPSGLSTFTELLNRYASTLYVVKSISSSGEFQNVCNGVGVPAGSFVLTEARDQNLSVTDVSVNAYRSLFGREPDIGGLNNLCQNLAGKNSEAVLNILFNLTQSAEFKMRNLNSRDYVIAIFTALCGRAPAEAEISVWQSLLAQDTAENRQSVFFLLGASSSCSSYLGAKLGISNFTGQEKGIDVSAHQKNVDWAQVAADGYTFAFIRAVSSNNTSSSPVIDAYFYQNVRNAKAAGLKVGVYFYSYAKTSEYMIEEVNTGLNAIHTMEKEGYTFDYPIVLDMEEFKTSGPDWVGLASLGLVIIDQQGYYPCLYSYANAFKNGILNMNDARLKGYDLWVAQYGSTLTYPGAIWQYTSGGSVPGVTGRCDLNISYRDFATIIRNAGKNKLR